jgi:hypothetical protein
MFTSARYASMLSKMIKSRRLRTIHATPDREETSFCRACIKRHSGCWSPP